MKNPTRLGDLDVDAPALPTLLVDHRVEDRDDDRPRAWVVATDDALGAAVPVSARILIDERVGALPRWTNHVAWLHRKHLADLHHVRPAP